MTKLTPEKRHLVAEVGHLWARSKIRAVQLEARIKARVEAEMAEARRQDAIERAEAMRAAVRAGVPKAALKEVTTKDHRTFVRYLEFHGNGTLP